MANFVDSNITHAGDLAIARVLAGEQLTFTKIELGDGRMPTGSLAADMTALVSTKAVVDIVKCEPETDGTAVVGGVFVNTFTPEGFEWRELGLFADVGDGEFLFSYGNAGDFCDYIPGSGGGTVVEKVIDVFTYVGDKANVTALIRADSYATVEQYLALKEEIQAAAEEADSARQSAILAAGTATSAATAANDAAARAEEGEAARIADEEERAAAEEDRALAELDRADEEGRRQAEFEQIRINAQSIRTVLLSDDQYDPVSRTPLIEGEQGVTYYIPSDDPQENNVYVEWQYLLRTDGTEAWEMFGRGSTVPDAITAADIDAVCDGGTEPVGTRTLTLTGFKYLIQKLRGVFAGIAHKHSAADITSGTLNAARIADGSIGSAKLDAALRECTTQSVDGSRLVAKTVSADKLADPLAYLVNGGGVLATPGWLMSSSHTVTLAKPISAQRSGIILVFSLYDGTIHDYYWNCHFVPKKAVGSSAAGHCFSNFSTDRAAMMKYLYISDTQIKGHDDNVKAGSSSGVSYDNGKYVLRYVIGV